MKIKYITIFLVFLFIQVPVFSQSNFSFGSISMSDLQMTEYEKDKEAVALYLLDWCEAKIDAEAEKPLKVKRHFRIKILKPQGLDYATIKLIYNAPRLPNFKACTYNLEDSIVKKIPLTKKDIFYEKRSNNSYRINIAFNNVKVGSIIECSYSMYYESIFQLYPWAFQHDIPVICSEYTAIFPNVFQYKYELHSNNLPIIQSRTEKNITISSVSTSEYTLNYKGEYLPAFESEPYMTSELDEMARVEFELARIELPNYFKNVTPTYAELSTKLLEDENFGIPLSKTEFLTKKVQKITEGLTNDIAKIKAIHTYLTENVKWNDETGIFTTYKNFRKILELQNGSATDINLLFIAMLRKAGVPAHPVVMSTRENGRLNPFYAIVTKFDYVVAYVRLNDKDYLIDVTDATRPFDQLPLYCLNGSGRLINERVSTWIPLNNKEQLFDQVMLKMKIGTDESLQGKIQRIYSSYSAYNIRKTIQAIGQEGYPEMLKQNHGNWEYDSIKIENLDSIDKQLIISYNLKTNDVIQQTSDLYIINPVLLFNRTENPFSTSERKYPIDFGCPEDELYSLNFTIPDGYTIDEHPANITLKLPDDAAIFTYRINKDSKQITIMYRYIRKQTHFEAIEYASLREFFSKMIQKQSELIILKKVNTSETTYNN